MPRNIGALIIVLVIAGAAISSDPLDLLAGWSDNHKVTITEGDQDLCGHIPMRPKPPRPLS